MKRSGDRMSYHHLTALGDDDTEQHVVPVTVFTLLEHCTVLGCSWQNVFALTAATAECDNTQ